MPKVAGDLRKQYYYVDCLLLWFLSVMVSSHAGDADQTGPPTFLGTDQWLVYASSSPGLADRVRPSHSGRNLKEANGASSLQTTKGNEKRAIAHISKFGDWHKFHMQLWIYSIILLTPPPSSETVAGCHSCVRSIRNPELQVGEPADGVTKDHGVDAWDS
jgi:hypothetical protein